MNDKSDPLEYLKRTVKELPNAVRQAGNFQAYHDLVAEVNNKQAQINLIAHLAQAIVEISKSITPEEKARLRFHLDDLQRTANIMATATSVEQAREAAFHVRELPKTSTPFRQDIQNAWIRQLDSRFAGAERLGRALSAIASLAGAGAEISEAVRKLDALRGRLPDSAVMQEVQEAEAKISTAKDRLNSAGLGEKETAFLLKVSDGEATMADVTTGVRAWIARHGLEHQLRILLR
jgi:hypothetical protein